MGCYSPVVCGLLSPLFTAKNLLDLLLGLAKLWVYPRQLVTKSNKELTKSSGRSISGTASCRWDNFYTAPVQCSFKAYSCILLFTTSDFLSPRSTLAHNNRCSQTTPSLCFRSPTVWLFPFYNKQTHDTLSSISFSISFPFSTLSLTFSFNFSLLSLTLSLWLSLFDSLFLTLSF